MYRSETAPWRPNSEICLIREESIKKKKKKKRRGRGGENRFQAEEARKGP